MNKKSFIKKQLVVLFEKFGLTIIRNQKFYYADENAKLVEFVGYAGKSHILKKISRELNLTPSRGVLRFDSLDNNEFKELIDIFPLLVKQIFLSHPHPFLKTFSLIKKSVILRNINNKSLFFDEGLIKEFLVQILDLSETEDDLVNSFLGKFKIVIIRADFEIAIDRYISRDKPSIQELENGRKYLYYYVKQIDRFKQYLENHKISYLEYNNNSDRIELGKIIDFILK